MSATLSERPKSEAAPETGTRELDALFRELDEEPARPDVTGPVGSHAAAGPAGLNRARSVRSARERVMARAGPVLMATGIALIAGGLLALRVSLPLSLALNVASLLLVVLGVLLLPEGSGRRGSP